MHHSVSSRAAEPGWSFEFMLHMYAVLSGLIIVHFILSVWCVDKAMNDDMSRAPMEGLARFLPYVRSSRITPAFWTTIHILKFKMQSSLNWVSTAIHDNFAYHCSFSVSCFSLKRALLPSRKLQLYLFHAHSTLDVHGCQLHGQVSEDKWQCHPLNVPPSLAVSTGYFWWCSPCIGSKITGSWPYFSSSK